MQHFANFIRLSNKNINEARNIISGDGKFPHGYDSQSFTRLSGYNPKKVGSLNTQYHDRVQHGMVTKELYRAATGTNPKQYFRDGSLAQKSPIMPIVQNRQLSPEKKDSINNATEDIVRVVASPETLGEKYGDRTLNYRAMKTYTKKTNTDGERLAGRATSRTLNRPDEFDNSKYYPKESDNQRFREQYLDKMKRNDSSIEKQTSRINSQLKKSSEISLGNTLKNKVSNLLGKSTPAGDNLRNKLEQRKAYSKEFDNPNNFTRDTALKYYETTGLMPR